MNKTIHEVKVQIWQVVVFVFFSMFAIASAFAETTYTWTGGSGNDKWEDPANWDSSQGEGVPGVDDDAILPSPAEGTYTVTASAAIDVKSLTVGGGAGAVTLTLSAPLTITDTLFVDGGATVVADQPVVVSNDVYVAAGGTMTHSLGTDAAPRKLNLTVGGNLTIAADGAIEANGKGASKKGGNPSGWGFCGSYAGIGSHATCHCYGSIRTPSDLGALGCFANNGGGAIRLNVAHVLRVDGSLTADADDQKGSGSGSGGSIWVTAGVLSGEGRISAVSYGYSNLTVGSGGRIAVRLTEASDFVDSDGIIYSYGNGTFYRENANDVLGRGELILNGAGTREFSKAVTDSEEPFGKITLVGTSGTRKISILDGVVVSTCGDFGTEGWTVEAAADTTGGVNVLGPRDGTVCLAGTMTLGAFICTNGTKAVEFAKGMTVSVADNGVLWLEGTDSRKTILKSSEVGSAWNLSAGVNLTGKVRNLDVSDSVASGQPIKARRSIGRKERNLNWEFPAGMALIIR